MGLFSFGTWCILDIWGRARPTSRDLILTSDHWPFILHHSWPGYISQQKHEKQWLWGCSLLVSLMEEHGDNYISLDIWHPSRLLFHIIEWLWNTLSHIQGCWWGMSTLVNSLGPVYLIQMLEYVKLCVKFDGGPRWTRISKHPCSHVIIVSSFTANKMTRESATVKELSKKEDCHPKLKK